MRKMNTATITWLHNGNYGTLLQAYALQQTIWGLGYDNVIIDYAPGRIMKVANLFINGNSPRLFAAKFRAWLVERQKRRLRAIKVTGREGDKKALIERFISNELKTTPRFCTPTELRSLSRHYDVYICGSDQIWNPTLFNPPYMFNFLSATDKRIAYAPSFGVESVETKKVSRISQLLNRFSHISVRERQGLRVLQQLGIATDLIPVVLDPTLLLTPGKWRQMIRAVTDQEPYILCYFLASNDLYWEAAKKLADKLKMKVVVIPEMEDSLKQPFEIRLDIGPKEWLGLVNSAGYVLTDSFHCVLFSLMFHKQFYAWKRYDDNDIGSQNSRLQNMLENVGLADRLLCRNASMCTETMTNICTFAHIDAYIEKEKRKSINWLIGAIER